MLELVFSINEGIAHVALSGRFDGLGAQIFEQEVEARISKEKQWVLQFDEVVYLSSAGIRSLIKYGKKLLKVEGKLILTGLNRDVKSVLETTGVLSLFGQAESLAEALAMINKEQYSQSTVESFTAFDRNITFQILSKHEGYIDIWNPLKSPSLNELNAGHLLAASLEDINMGFGIGALGSDRSNAMEGLGSFITMGKMAGVLPADGYNHPDFMIVKQAQEAIIYIAAAVGFSGHPWGKIDLPEGSPVPMRDLQRLIFDRLKQSRDKSAAILGMAILAKIQPGNEIYYQNYEDLMQNTTLNRKLAGQQSMLLLGLGGSEGWEGDEQLALLLKQRGIRAGEEFFLGNGLLFSDLLDWRNIKEPEEVLHYCSNLDLLQDVFMADKDTTITGGRIWLFVPGLIRSGQEKLVQIEVADEMPFPEEWEIITRRLYSDARRVILEPLHGGFSPAKPFRVISYDQDNRRMLPTVLKLGPGKSVEREIQNHQKYVHNYILNNSTTIMGTSSYKTSTGMRYNFVGISGPDSNLTWLTNRFRENPVDQLMPLFDEIFTHILKPWYGQPRWEIIKPYQEHNPLINFPNIFEAAEKEFGISAQEETIECPELGLVLPNPYHFLQYEYPARQSVSQLWYTGINHGDLNMQNILLDERDNVYIIDFSDTRPRNIVSDFARLEPIFKFEMTRLKTQEDLDAFLEFEQALSQVNSLQEELPFVYRGTDPAMEKVYQMICQIRKYAKTVVIFETDIIPYLLAMLEWIYPIVVFRQMTPFGKKAATYSAALIVQQIKRLEINR